MQHRTDSTHDIAGGTPRPSDGLVLPRPKPEGTPGVRRATGGLRLLGSLLILASASTFLFQQWDAAAHLERFGLLVLHTVLLAAAGFFCGLGMKESRSARTLLGIALSVMPIQFGVLGGLVYSQYSVDVLAQTYPAYATWLAPSGPAALLAVAATLIVSTPVAFLAFRAMARPLAGSLTVAMTLGNLLLLVPTRSPDFVGPLALLAFAGLVWLELRHWRRAPAMDTFEGNWARAVIAAPAVLMVARSIVFYPTSALFLAAMLATLAGVTLLSSRLVESEGQSDALRFLSTIPAGAAALQIGQVVGAASFLPGSFVVPAVALPFAGYLWLTSHVGDNGRILYRGAALALALGGLGLNMVLYPSIGPAFTTLVAACAVIAWGLVAEQRLLFLGGAAVAAVALLYQVRFAIEAYSLSHWGSLAVLGVVVILLASLIDRSPARVRALLTGSGETADPQED